MLGQLNKCHSNAWPEESGETCMFNCILSLVIYGFVKPFSKSNLDKLMIEILLQSIYIICFNLKFQDISS